MGSNFGLYNELDMPHFLSKKKRYTV